MLIAYPRDFRREYGDDMAQGFRDLMMSAPDGRGVWSRTIRDLFSSASKERGSAILGGGRRPSRGSLAAIAGLVVVIAMVGPGVGLVFFLVPSVILFGLPIFGVSRFYRAWLVRRTTGGAMAKQILIGVAAFVPAAVLLPFIGEDAGYWIFIAVGFTFIAGSALGIIWAVTALFKSLRDRGPSRRRWVRPVIILIPSLAILGFIIGASYNSYRNSLGPAGDHSVANASADTRALWEAANAGDVAAVVDLTTDTCADPWVKFPQGNGRHNAKGQAETRELELPDDQEPPFREIAGILGDYMDDWHHRCPQTAD
jgi:hypothetical protein